MATPNPASHAVTALANAEADYNIPAGAKVLSVINRTGAAEVFLTTDGTAPTVAGDNQWYLPAAITQIDIPLDFSEPGETAKAAQTLKAISSSALSLWVEVSE